MNAWKRISCATAAFLVAAAASARDLEPYCWFYAGFDTPVRIAGGAFPQTPDASGYRDGGRYGRAYYFHAKAENVLPPMASFLADAANFTPDEGATLATGETLTLDGGLSVAPRHVSIRNSYSWVTVSTGFTCSFYAKGPVGTEVSATVVLTPLTESEIATISKKCTGGDLRTLDSTPLTADTTPTATFAMTGGWRRVQCHAVLDNREKFVGRTVALRIVTSGGAVEMNRFQYHQTAEYPRLGNYSASVWVDGGESVEPSVLKTSDPVYLKSFPWSEGSFTCWVKCPIEDGDSSHAFPLWGLARSWTANWGFNGQTFTTGTGRSTYCYDTAFTMPREWRHYAGTWKDGEMRVYVDGQLLEKRVKTGVTFEDMTLSGTPVFRCGSRQDGDSAADAMVDDIAIFSTALTADEVAAIASSETPLFAGSTTVLAEPVAFTHFYRNQTNAAIRTKLTVAAAATVTVRSSFADESQPPFVLDLPAGDTWLDVPFNPSRLRPGEQPWSFSLEDANGKVCLAREGTLTVRDRRERDAWRMMSWGGSQSIHAGFLKTCDFDSVNCSGKSSVESTIASGLQANIRYENSGKIKTYDFDYDALAAQATNDLAYAKGLHDWTATLLNSEVYNAGTAWNYTNSAKFLATAREEIGCEPEWSFGDGMNGVGVSYGKLGEKVPTGVVDGSHRTFRTLLWYNDVGMPQYRANNATAKAIREWLCPDGIAWTEPIMMPGGMALKLDMMADWFYEYDPSYTLASIRSAGGQMRGVDRAFMPTLAFGYWSNVTGTNPETPGTTVKTTLGQSADELEIKSWMCLGAVRSDHLSIFAADSWEWGLTGAVTHATSPTNSVSMICDLVAPTQFGAFVRTRLRPAAALLRGIKNVRAPVAFVLTGEGYYAGGFGWTGYHYPRAYTWYLSKYGVPFDYVYDYEINAETLPKYPYILFPMTRLVTEAHDAAFRAAGEKGSTIVLDTYATFTYPNAVQLPIKSDYGYYEKNLKAPFFNWYSNVCEDVKARLPAWSESDFDGEPSSYTFCKELDGVGYVVVVNNARREGGGVLTDFHPSSTYKPYGAPQQITTHLKVPAGGCVYLFNGADMANSSVDAASSPVDEASSPRQYEGGLLFERRGGDAASTGQAPSAAETFIYESDYAAAEGRVFVVAPRLYASVDIDVDGTGGALAPGGVGAASVVVRDADGAAAAGRQIVRVTFTAPNGAVRDESGDYAVEGELKFPLRFARGEELGTAARPWRLVVRELASGLAATNEFVLTGPECVNTVANYVKPGLVSFWDAEFPSERRGGDAASTGTVDRCLVDGVMKAERVYDRALNGVELAHNQSIDDFRYRELTARVTRNAASYADLGEGAALGGDAEGEGAARGGDAAGTPRLQAFAPTSVTPMLGQILKHHEKASCDFAVEGLTVDAASSPRHATVASTPVDAASSPRQYVAVTNGVRCIYEGFSLTTLADDGTETTRSYDAPVTSATAPASNDCFAVWRWRPQFALDVSVEGKGAVSFDGGAAATNLTVWCDATGGVSVAVAALPESDWVLTGWRGDTAGLSGAADDPLRRVPVDAPRQLTAVFEWAWAITNSVTVAGDPENWGDLAYGKIDYPLASSNVEWSVAAALATFADSARAVALGSQTRAVYAGYTLTNATGVVAFDTAESFLWQRRKGDSLTVHWTLQHAVSATVLGNSGGTVRLASASAVDEGATAVAYANAANGTVTATAIPAAGWKFSRWLGDVSGSDATKTTLTLATEAPKNLKAVFEEEGHVPVTRTWSGGAAGDWDDAAGWGGTVPQTGDDVVFADGTARTVLLSHETPALNSITVGSKATLVVSNWTTRLLATRVTVKNGGTVKCQGALRDNGPSNRVWIACTDLEIAKGGVISADLAGYGGTNGPAWAASAAGTTSGDSYRAASYGGRGSGASSAGTKGSRCYGSLVEPLDPGSGGGLWGRTGGGAIRLDCAGDVTINGSVSAEGAATQIWNGGGASGGAIYISCRSIAGAGTVSAADRDCLIQYGHHGGGGGRIAVHYDAAAQLASDCRVRFSAKGGAGLYTGTPNRLTNCGGPGTLWFTDDQFLTNATYGTVGWQFAGEWHSGTGATKIDVPRGVTMAGSSLVFVPPVEEVDIHGNLSITGQYSAVNLAGGASAHIHVRGDCFVDGARLKLNGGSLVVDGDFTLGATKPRNLSAAELYLLAAPTNASTGTWGCEFSVGRTLTFSTNTIAYFEGASTNGAIPRVTAKDVRQLATSTLTANSLGWAARKGPAAGSPTAHSWSAGYGGHGATGSYVSQASVTYGSEKTPLDLGSGGSVRGGGAIYITASDSLQLNGTVTANGGAGSAWTTAGAGGSVYISTAKFLPSTATVTACGGASGAGWEGYEGGGGRIAIWRETGVTNGLTVSAAAGAWTGSWSCKYPATAGSVYLGRLKVDIETEAIAAWVADELAAKFKADGETVDAYRARFVEKFGEDLEAAFFKETGKVGFGGTPLRVWEDYVAGTDPLDEKQQFTATISLDPDTGLPVVEWSPKLNDAETARRVYTTQGKSDIGEAEWHTVNGDAEKYKFFKVSVEMR